MFIFAYSNGSIIAKLYLPISLVDDGLDICLQAYIIQ